MEQIDAPASPGQKKRQEGHIGLGGVAGRAGEHEVVGPVVGGLAFPGPDVVEGDVLSGDGATAIGADRAMLGEEPVAVGLI